MQKNEMFVTKRGGTREPVSFDKVLHRISVLCKGLENVNPYEISQKVCTRIFNGVSTAQLDELAAQLCSSMIVDDGEYGILATRIIVSNHHKETIGSFVHTIRKMHGHKIKLVSDELLDIVNEHGVELDASIDYAKDYDFDYFGFKTLEKSYLMRMDDVIVERPQHMFMRVALGIHGFNIAKATETYELMSSRFFIHATPTLFNAGTMRPQNSSCYLVNLESDSIDGIFNTVKDCAQISKYAGGIGMHIHHVRSKNSVIRGTNGRSDGIIPMLRVFNTTARYVNQSGKRNGSIAVFLEPWHADIEAFLDLRKNFGNEEERARDLFMAMWISDLFMERVRDDKQWSLMCPDVCPGLSDVHSAEFATLYTHYESMGLFVKQMPARDIWFKILESQIETGVPYIGFKDAVNAKSNQSNLGTIKSSNLCMEICEYSAPDEIAVCNLASVCLPRFVSLDKKTFDYDELHRITKVAARNLDKIIDRNFYPLEKARKSNLRHRPIGVGVQGLADVFMMLKFPFESPEARAINKRIFETMYHAALEASVEASIEHCAEGECNEYESRPGPYSTFDGSPASKGLLQFDLWNKTHDDANFDWDAMRERIKLHGMRNSLLIAPMPTASTSQILGANECFEPMTSNMYKRQTLAGEFIVINKHLMRDLQELGLWGDDMKVKIMLNEGSVQAISEIPADLREVYKTAWEMKMKSIIDMAADRGPFICQSQSMNLFIESPDFQKLSAMHFYSWKAGLKTGIYYLRSRAKAKAQQFTIDPANPNRSVAATAAATAAGPSCSIGGGPCESCSA